MANLAVLQPRPLTGLPGNRISSGFVPALIDPVSNSKFKSFFHLNRIQSLTKHEVMLLHADIMSLTQQLGLSYKDAAHRLYSAEIECLKMADSATKAIGVIKQRIRNLVSQELGPPIDAIDAGRFDDYVLLDGQWKKITAGSGEASGPPV